MGRAALSREGKRLGVKPAAHLHLLQSLGCGECIAPLAMCLHGQGQLYLYS